MITSGDGPFINVSRLNMQKYASHDGLAKPLFEYLFYVENDTKHVSSFNKKKIILFIRKNIPRSKECNFYCSKI